MTCMQHIRVTSGCCSVFVKTLVGQLQAPPHQQVPPLLSVHTAPSPRGVHVTTEPCVQSLGVFLSFPDVSYLPPSLKLQVTTDSHALRLASIPHLVRRGVYQPLIGHERNRSVLSPRLGGMRCQSNQRWWKLIALMSAWPCNFISSLHMPCWGFTPITTFIN